MAPSRQVVHQFQWVDAKKKFAAGVCWSSPFVLSVVTAYRDALALSESDGQLRLELAVTTLNEDGFVVLFEHQIALRRERDRILCEVIDPYAQGPNSADRYQKLLDSAQALFRESALYRALSDVKLDWIVVNDYGTGTIQLWPR